MRHPSSWFACLYAAAMRNPHNEMASGLLCASSEHQRLSRVSPRSIDRLLSATWPACLPACAAQHGMDTAASYRRCRCCNPHSQRCHSRRRLPLHCCPFTFSALLTPSSPQHSSSQPARSVRAPRLRSLRLSVPLHDAGCSILSLLPQPRLNSALVALLVSVVCRQPAACCASPHTAPAVRFGSGAQPSAGSRSA